MAEQEGVIRFEIRRVPPRTLPADILRTLDEARTHLGGFGWVGQDPDRYHGLGFGNLSLRLPEGFAITGSQTGHLPHLTARDVAVVERIDLVWGVVTCWAGTAPPSSESMTHAAIYGALAGVRAVWHVHAPGLWRAPLDCEETAADIPYGTRAMAEALAACASRIGPRGGLVRMAGHEDGMLAFGPTPGDATRILLEALAAIEEN